MFQATIDGKSAPLTRLRDEDIDINTMNTTKKKPWITRDVLDLCDERKNLRKRYEAEGAKKYREANKRVYKAVKKAQADWITAQCEEIVTCLYKNNSKRVNPLVKDLTSEKQGKSSTI